MNEQIQIQQWGQNRQLVTPMDLFRASQFFSHVLSGANNYVSGYTILSGITSNVVRIRPLNMHLHNRESSHMTVVFRDGSISGTIVAGPFKISPTNEMDVVPEQLNGRYFTSGIYPVVISGTYAAGIDVNMGYVLEPDPNQQGGLVE